MVNNSKYMKSKIVCNSSIWVFSELKWLPKTLPKNVSIILSTLPDSEHEQFGFLTKLQSMFNTDGTTFLEIKEIPARDGQKTIERYEMMLIYYHFGFNIYFVLFLVG